jgi:AAA15 family ATPase/GTPase
MIKYIEISNFYSINTEQVLDFEIGLTADSKFKTQLVLGFAGITAIS